MNSENKSEIKSEKNPWRFWAIGGVVAIFAVLCFVYWPSMRMLTRKWEEPDYSHGYLVPVFAGVLLWVRREMYPREQLRGSWWGGALIALSGLMYLGAGILGFNLIIAFALIPCLAGIVLMLGGWPLMRWSWPAIFFLLFMIPLPMALETMARIPLQKIAARASTYALQTFGLPAVAEGNVIQLSDYSIGVAEACSGLRMLMTSAALTFGLAFILQRPLWERLVILASAVPIALLTNMIRITVTGLCYEYFGPEVAEQVFHGLAGLLMMPLAVGLLWLEIVILSRLTIEPAEGATFAGALASK